IANADSAVGLTPLYKIRDFGLNNLILNNNQPLSFFSGGDIIWIGIISQFLYQRLSFPFILRLDI
ncbi:MAG TPA: hypothetical protein PLA32_01905, partial [Smithella sp.]|nr:hypothetical protein [Smithella sp.]